MRRLVHALLALAVVVGGTAFADRLDDIIARDALVCGVNESLPGFGTINSEGDFVGFDVDFCKAIAAAILGDASKVEYRALSAQERFTAVQTGEVDVLIRNTTWTSSRDTSVGLEFAPTTFYDGQGFMTRRDSGITTLQDLEGRSICVQSGTTTELNLNDVLSALNISFTPVIYENLDQLTAAYDQGACDANTTDKSGLATSRLSLQNPDDHIILDATISKEPLGPSVLNGEQRLFDVVKWVVFGVFTAEEYGITSENVEEIAATTEVPSLRRMLGVEGTNVADIGMQSDGILQAILQVGNYEEIYNRYLGPDTQFNIPRGLNQPYTEGGLLYAPPFR
ncbi:MAG TPA: amino acid ABC transporter substrate-binding protein [Trueperaceae bacterium]|nr:amino acid ABC transporter substrate-binding protein [Trueperaceae bacterium]